MTCRILVWLLAATAPSVSAELYACMEADGRPRYTDVAPGAQACKRVSALPTPAERNSFKSLKNTPAVAAASESALWLGISRTPK